MKEILLDEFLSMNRRRAIFLYEIMVVLDA